MASTSTPVDRGSDRSTDQERQCLLVVSGADAHGSKELVGLSDGYGESEQSWRELLVDLRHGGLDMDPELAEIFLSHERQALYRGEVVERTGIASIRYINATAVALKVGL